MRVEPKPTPREAAYRRALFWKGEYDSAVAELSEARAALEEARRETLAEAIRAVEDERLMEPDPGCEGDRAYNLAVHDCAQAIRALAEVGATTGGIRAAPEARAQGEGGEDR